MNMELLGWMIAAHFVGDYALQSDWVAKNKCVSWYVLVAHCVIWTACVCVPLAIFADVKFTWVLFLFGAHLISDNAKCRGWYGLAADQCYHFGQIIIVWFFNH